MATTKSTPRTYKERYAAGKAMREACPSAAHAAWKPPMGRPDAVETVLKAEKGRLPDLLPLRHGRMLRSAFTFYRGSALAMATDLASTPVSGIRVQCCGDRELREETGFRAGRYERLGSFYPAPSWSTEFDYLYLATQVRPGPPQREADEAIELLHVPLAETIEMIQTGAIIDVKTMAALLLAQRRLNTEGREP